MRQTSPFFHLLSRTQIATLRSRMPPEGTDECWIWVGWKSKQGYGGYSVSRRRFASSVMPAHRAVFAVYANEDPHPFHVLHKCNNPPCVNPRHLYKGTDAENHRDRVMAGTSGLDRYTRETAPKRKLSIDQIRSIKRRIASGEKQSSIAKAYGIHQVHVSRIKTGKQWADIIP